MQVLSSHMTPTVEQASPWWRRAYWFLPAAAIVVLMHLRFLFTPVISDEGAFLAVARAWRGGAVLYRDTWADRPQGQFLLYRVIDSIGLGNRVGIRLLAMAACLLGAAASGVIAGRLSGRRAQWITAVVVGVLASVPRYEAFTANGELLSCSIGAVALACVLSATSRRERPSLALLFIGGVAGGAALTVKQTGFDALVTATLVLGVLLFRAAWTRRDRLAAAAAAVIGFLVPMTTMVVHAAATGWGRWWYAIVTYRSTNRSVLGDADWKRFLITGRTAAPVLAPAVLLLIVVLARRAYRGHRRESVVLAVWCAAAFLAFLLGGQFFRHYLMILVFPFGTTVGVIIASVSAERSRHLLLAGVLVSPIAFTAQAITVPRADAGMRFSQDQWSKPAERVADWFEERARPQDRIYALCAAGSLYGNLDVPAPFPYLWLADVKDVPGARDELVGLLASDAAPRFVAQFQDPKDCDATGALEQALHGNYALADTVLGVEVYERSSRA